MNFSVKTALSFALIFVSIGCSLTNPTVDLRTENAVGVIGGTAVIEESPISRSTVLLFGVAETTPKRKAWWCTGSIISGDIIITAAHCLINLGFSSQTKNVSSRLAVVFKNQIRDTDKIKDFQSNEYFIIDKSQVKIHPKYNVEANGFAYRDRPNYDIGIIKLGGLIPERASIASLLKDYSLLKRGVLATTAGYGISPEATANRLYQLRQAQIPILDPLDAKNRELQIYDPSKRNKKRVSSGDSGGPTYLKFGDRQLLFGIVSSGGDEFSTSQIELIKPYSNWIKAEAKSLGSNLNIDL